MRSRGASGAGDGEGGALLTSEMEGEDRPAAGKRMADQPMKPPKLRGKAVTAAALISPKPDGAENPQLLDEKRAVALLFKAVRESTGYTDPLMAENDIPPAPVAGSDVPELFQLPLPTANQISLEADLHAKRITLPLVLLAAMCEATLPLR